jgi:hypothetical protein
MMRPSPSAAACASIVDVFHEMHRERLACPEAILGRLED